jgi:hypothetical protein
MERSGFVVGDTRRVISTWARCFSVRRDGAGVRLRYLEALRGAMLAWAQLRPFLRS